MTYCRYLLYGFLALLISGCGQTVKQKLMVPPAGNKSTIGAGKSVVILHFADYSYANNVETAYRRNLFVTENVTDRLVSNSFLLPVQEDVFLYLVNHKFINILSYEDKRSYSLEDELKDEWSAAMKSQLQRYIDQSNSRTTKPVLNAPGTHGLTQQAILKIGKHFKSDYVLRGRIIRYKTRQDPSWAPWKKGIISFVTGVTSKIAFGQASSEKYDNINSMTVGGSYGAAWGYHHSNVPYDGQPDRTIFGVSGSDYGNAIIWGALGGGLGHLAQMSGDVPQAVVQLRIWVQDTYNGDVVWTNRVDVKVSPETILSDYQYDKLYEKATEKAVTTLITDFVTSGI